MSTGEYENTDVYLFQGDGFSVHRTENGGLGIEVGGSVIVRPPKVWFATSARIQELEASASKWQETAMFELNRLRNSQADIEHLTALLAESQAALAKASMDLMEVSLEARGLGNPSTQDDERKRFEEYMQDEFGDEPPYSDLCWNVWQARAVRDKTSCASGG